MNTKKAKLIRKAARKLATDFDPLQLPYGFVLTTAEYPAGHYKSLTKTVKRAYKAKGSTQ